MIPMLNFVELYEKHADYVFFMCSRFETDNERADTLNHDVWRRIRRQLPQLQGAHEETWLCRKIVDTHRRLARSFRPLPDLTDSVRRRSPIVRFKKALDRLNLEYRWPLVLKECAGFSYAEISEILEVPTGTVRARLGRARGMLARYQEDDL